MPLSQCLESEGSSYVVSISRTELEELEELYAEVANMCNEGLLTASRSSIILISERSDQYNLLCLSRFMGTREFVLLTRRSRKHYHAMVSSPDLIALQSLAENLILLRHGVLLHKSLASSRMRQKVVRCAWQGAKKFWRIQTNAITKQPATRRYRAV